ncbi:MAG TPA: NAD-dependent epimerase/dehydratase family protein [Spirochaetota bacterium]|nr:NAD-dependent epimerase/dehydratase family protein [Spirochaetota bacterium]HPC40297.1 NAD-dependent epimerase/dehydratase family protein [Spirochaetota bacterium]HQF07229.1 NAD-dependent epimerase/dehydratase family protein [Spirochaetota bacterium]HQH96129.1 NAD-dependent epimerase/dehydratase family protein [Spirochaetota bacterium]HQJ69305.1 NAD-dependent epimerase/dehydratase family protein [Spirochaetota bacterium]
MKALVTGATGFIGSVLAEELMARGHGVRALAFPEEKVSELVNRGAEICRGDLTAPESLRGLCDGVDTVFHLAGRVTDWGTRKQFYTAIYNATENLLKEAAGKASRFVYVSSLAAMGMGGHLKGVKETDPPRKSGVYYNDAKADAEALVRSYHDAGAIACTIVRPANVTGPGSVWVRDIIDQMLKMPVPLFDRGRHPTSFVYVDSLVDGIIRAGTMDVARGRAYHFRDDWTATWKEYITFLGSLVGKRPRGNIPFRLAWPLGLVMEKILNPLQVRSPLTRLNVGVLGRNNDIDTSLARAELGWRTTVSYSEAMERIAAWVRTHYAGRR